MKRILAILAARYPLFAVLLTTHLRATLLVAAGGLSAINVIVYAHAIMTADNLVTHYGPVVGGDYVVFRLAALSAGEPDMSELYDAEAPQTRLKAMFPGGGDFLLFWAYPPTFSLLLWPLAAPPYLASFGFWVAAGLTALFISLRTIQPKGLTLFLAMASPAVFQGVITGQTGLFTGALMATAAGFATKRPMLAGLAAGLLTVKPQLGILLPIAFIAGGCWRAFFAAAASAIALALATLAAFGEAPWIAFVHALIEHGGRMGEEGFPLHKLVSFFGAASVLGASDEIAGSVQAVATCLLAAFVAIVWRRIEAPDLRLAVICAAAPLATPYAYYYEFAIVVPAIVAIARRAVDTGWLSGERLCMAALWAAPMAAPGPDLVPGFPVCAATAMLALFAVARRAAPAAGIKFSSAASPARSDAEIPPSPTAHSTQP